MSTLTLRQNYVHNGNNAGSLKAGCLTADVVAAAVAVAAAVVTATAATPGWASVARNDVFYVRITHEKFAPICLISLNFS